MFTSKYIYLSSQSFKSDIYVNNCSFDFTNNILYPFKLELHNWEVALTEISWSPTNYQSETDLYVMSDIVDRSIQVGTFFPGILRIIRKPTIFSKLYYVPISREYINSIRIYVKLENNTKPETTITGNRRCTLHFRKRKTR